MRVIWMVLLASGCAARAHVGLATPLTDHPAERVPVVATHLDAVPGSFRFRTGKVTYDTVGPFVPGVGVGARVRPTLAGGAVAAGPEVMIGIPPSEAGIGGALRIGVLPMFGAASDGWADLALAIPIDLSITLLLGDMPVSIGATLEYDRWATPWVPGTWWVGGNIGAGW
ncbi:MAG: hypothetical protein ACI8PZ_000619 [Myxococcota bacterium]|jgi:hypothetical protein